MFGHRTPDTRYQSGNRDAPKVQDQEHKMTERAAPPATYTKQSKVRTSVGEIEARTSTSPPPPQTSASQPVGGQRKAKKLFASPTHKAGSQRMTAGVGAPMTTAAEEKSPGAGKYLNRTTEAKACLMKAKLHLGNSRNLKSEIKNGVSEAVERLYILVKEAEEAQNGKVKDDKKETERPTHSEEVLIKKMEEHGKLLKENSLEIEKLTEALKKEKESRENRVTYASVVAGSPRKQPPETAAMYSVIVASTDEEETGEEVYERLKSVVNAKEEGAKIDRIRKVKDRKIVMGCRNREEIEKLKKRIAAKDSQLSVEDIQRKDPLIIMYGVLNSNSDEDILKAIRVQNISLLRGIKEGDDHIEIRFRRRARNPHTSHVVARVSPQIWQSLTYAGAVHIDMQRIRVADQSPLVQCSRCLGYGHGRRFCPDAVDVCSHCGGAHVRTECPEYITDAPPSCVNCIKAKAGKADHNAFSSDCPVRRKWDSLARATVAYC